ncbi:MAG: polysaccharide biosynthesis tyrosine autokinase, partial [Chitinophagaceae bacterium]
DAEKLSLWGTGAKYTAELKTIPERERELMKATRQQATKNNIYNYLLQKREEAALSFAFAIEDSRLVDRAESGTTPISPHKRLVYTLAVIVGLALAFGLIAFKDQVNPGIRSREDIEAISSFPIIGNIAHAVSKKPLVIGDGEQSFVAEQFRQIRTSLLYQGAKKKLLITSSKQGEGKTFIASNIAVSLALTDKSVVLVELDLRRPRLNELFNKKQYPGMSEYLSGKINVEKIIQKTSVHNLFLVTAGSIPENPSELILNAKLEECFGLLEKKFDFMVIETAPVNAVTDAYILSRHSDAVLYVVRQGLTKKADLKLVEENTRIKGLNNPRIIFNGVKADGLTANTYQYNSTT